MARFPEAMARIFDRVYVCRKCKTKMRAAPQKVILKKVKCRKCNSKALRPKHRERKG
jgi:ribosomal protein L40E